MKVFKKERPSYVWRGSGVFRTTGMSRKEEVDWLSPRPLIYPQSIRNERPQELTAQKDQLTHLTSARRPGRCARKENNWYLKGSGSSLVCTGQIGQS